MITDMSTRYHVTGRCAVTVLDQGVGDCYVLQRGCNQGRTSPRETDSNRKDCKQNRSLVFYLKQLNIALGKFPNSSVREQGSKTEKEIRY